VNVTFKAIIATLALFIFGCASDRYNYNLRHAHVAPQVHLQRGDFEEVVHLVTNATHERMISISRPYKPHRGQVLVLTELANGTGGHHFWLEKANSKWRIVDSNEIEY
jgi:hypothetical protein